MTVDDVLATSPGAHKLLGTTSTVRAPDADQFARKVGPYIDSKRRGKRGVTASPIKKSRANARTTSLGLLDFTKFRHPQQSSSQTAAKSATVMCEPHASSSAQEEDKEEGDGVFYPLVDSVVIRCKAPALRAGAVLMDLPGLMDSDAARSAVADASKSAVARRRLGEADHIFIVAPVKRAVNDHLAKTLLTEQVKRQIKMGESSGCFRGASTLTILTAIFYRVAFTSDQRYSGHGITFIATHTDDASPSDIVPALRLEEDTEYQGIQTRLDDLQENIGDLTADIAQQREEYDDAQIAFQEHQTELAMMRENEGKAEVQQDESHGARQQGDRDSDAEPATKKRKISRDEELTGLDTSTDDVDDVRERQCDLEAQLHRIKEALSGALQVLSSQETKLREERDLMSAAQLDMNAYASRKRSEWAKAELKADFKLGIAQSGQTQDCESGAGQARRTDDLPVFCCSSRDYLRLKGFLPGDGPATCFIDPAGTEIPALQEWCVHLTLPARLEAAARYLAHVKAFATTVAEHVAKANSETNPGFATLKLNWETPNHDEDPDGEGEEDELEEPQGLGGRLSRSFNNIAWEEFRKIQGIFDKTLADICTSSADMAAAEAPNFVDELASAMQWNTLRATLRRHGSWRQDINEGMADPLYNGIQDVWARIFSSPFFGTLSDPIIAATKKLLTQMAKADPDVRDAVIKQGRKAIHHLKASVKDAVTCAEVALAAAQRRTSREIVPFIQQGLVDGYEGALAEGRRIPGKGSAARERAKFQEFVNGNCVALFKDCASMLVGGINEALDRIKKDLIHKLQDLAGNVEVEMSALWSCVPEGKPQIRARVATTTAANVILRQLSMWEEAHRRVAQTPTEQPESIPMEG
ncbi:hypothetical protein FA95DRAFT_1609409 [Auriscalpium vulgare]|uniref:Uncharacterized protein n=1 Tax=Auriscalpium vulgare TaxID=40419 RepID=A0ACB8RGR8_9AGAM|nr:hypothetical protein FA95DRAFT_1609409 [Auriscalpium vulgare]